MNIGQRVAIPDGAIGHVEEIDPDGKMCGVRVLTPKNVPSCCITWCWTEQLIAVPDHVLPQPRSEEWHRKSREFCAMVEAAVHDMIGSTSTRSDR